MGEEVKQINSDDDYRLKILDPSKVEFFRAGDALRVTIEGDRSCLRVVPMRVFPLSMRDQYISLRDMEGNELGIIKEPDKLEKNSRKLLEEEIRKRYFTPVIRSIKNLKDKFGIVEWEVETDRGLKNFLTRSLHESLTESSDGFIITDMENNRYEIREMNSLDPRSVSILDRKI